MSVEAAVEAWKKLADRKDLIGKKVVFVNRLSENQEGIIRKISVEDGRFVIESDDIKDGLRFLIDAERYPMEGHGMIFCDLADNYRQIQISTT